MISLVAPGNETSPISIVPLKIILETADRAELAGTYYPCSNCAGTVLICSAPGIRQETYAAFAQFLNKQGFSALTFDYRGIGQSLFEMRIKKSNAKQADWGELDISAAIAYLSRRHPRIPLHVVAHDMAAVLVGLAPDHALISSMVSIGGTAFYVPEMTGMARFRANLFFKFYIPLCLFVFGYVPLKFLDSRADIPAGAAKQWMRWCLRPGHIRNSFGIDIKKYFYKDFHSPILVLDTGGELVFGAIEPREKNITELYRSTEVENIKIAPKNYGFKKIDHLDIFKIQYEKLWTTISDWLKAPERQTIRTYAIKAKPEATATLEAASRNCAMPVTYTAPDLPVGNSPTMMHVGARINGQPTKFVGAGCKKKAKA